MTGSLGRIFDDAVAALDPEPLVARTLADLRWPGEVVGIAVGKAALAMARGAAGVAKRGLVVAPVLGQAPWRVMAAAHPIPDVSSEAAGRALLETVGTVPRDGLLVALISGGASALAAVPLSGMRLADKVARIRAVANAGAPIRELNLLRASLSAIKAGQLAYACPAPVLTLVASDVVGDDPHVVGSAPTVGAWTRRLGKLADLNAAPTVTEVGRGIRARDGVLVIAGLSHLAAAAQAAATRHGWKAMVLPTFVEGDVADVAARLEAELASLAPGTLAIAVGEPTLRLPDSPGRGGRATQLALLLADRLRGRRGWQALVAGSDGIDGTGPAAGGCVDGDTCDRLAAAGVDVRTALARCDAGTALAAIGADVLTGPTGINHADLVLLAAT